MVAEARESNPVSPGYEPGMVIRSTRQQWYSQRDSNPYFHLERVATLPLVDGSIVREKASRKPVRLTTLSVS